MKSRVILLLSIMFSVLEAGAVSSLDSARNAYESGRYADAIRIYKNVEKSKGTSAALLANLGNAYVKTGDYGNAFVSYERSLRLDPSNKEVRNNRAYILSKIEDANMANAKGKKVSVVPDEPTFFTKVRHYMTHSHTSNTWAIWAGVSFVLLCGCIALYVFASTVYLRKIGFFGGITMIVLCIAFLIFSFSSAKACDTHEDGVVTGFKVTLLTEPYSSAKPSGTPLVKGTKLSIIERETGAGGKVEWYKVRLNSDFVGWIQASDFEII